jgi:hypothetical protein
MAGMVSPMNFKTSPLFASTASHIGPNYWLSISINWSRGSDSDVALSGRPLVRTRGRARGLWQFRSWYLGL